jgi:uncharacterized protein
MEDFMDRKKVFVFVFCFTGSIFFFTGCNAPKDHLTQFNQYYKAADFNEAMVFAKSKIGKTEKPGGEDLLWSLQIGAVEFQVGDYNKSEEYFDKSEQMLNYYDYQNEATASVASTLVNDNVVAYLGEEYDGIMVNTYKALDFMALGKHDLARIEFNRALDRQTRAKEQFAKEIAKLKDEVAKEQQSQQQKNVDLEKNVDNPQIQDMLKTQYPNLYEYKAYPDFVNPFTTYIAGVYFNLVQDPAKAVDLLKESHGMLPDNQYITEDFTATENLLNGKEKISNTVWVIFENGLGPTKEEVRIDLPLFVVTSSVKYVGIALPKLVPGEQAYPSLVITADGKQYQTQVVSDMERVIQTEFNKDFPGILTRAIVSATVKAAAQYAIEQQNSSAASLASALMAVYSFATTAADVRIWSTLPKDFQVARLKIPTNRTITILSPEQIKLLDVNIPSCNNAIVYVKIPFRYAVPSYEIITFNP